MSRAWLLAVASVLTAVAIGAGTATARQTPARPPLGGPVETRAAEPPAAPPPVELLRSWDARRADAWARGDPRLLRTLYTPGSMAGRRDRTMLRAWAARGLVVRQLRTQLLSVRVLGHRGAAWTLVVTDRVAGGVAVGAGVRRRLPQDRPTTRTVRFRRWAGGWRVAWVRPGEVRA
jgi:hypothetical protein